MERVDELIKRTKNITSLEEAYVLDNEIINFLNDKDVSEKQKQKLRSEGFLEIVAIASDGYKHKNKLEHYSEEKQSTSK